MQNINMLIDKANGELIVPLEDGRKVPLKEIIAFYEEHNNVNPMEYKVAQKVYIDLDEIMENAEKIDEECLKYGQNGRKYLEYFKEARKVAKENPEKYPRHIETGIVVKNWTGGKTEKELREIPRIIGYKQADLTIMHLRMQELICNDVSLKELLGYMRLYANSLVIDMGENSGYYGGKLGRETDVAKYDYNPNREDYESTPLVYK